MVGENVQQRLLLSLGQIYSSQQASNFMGRLLNEVAWQTDYIAYGRRVEIPRLQAWYADEGIYYRYSDNKLQSHAWIDSLLEIKRAVESRSGYLFNSVLLTHYRDGNDSVGWHADDEAELGSEPVIASLSLGATREFHFRHKQHAMSASMQLHDGELIVMKPEFQEKWEHCVLAQPSVDKPRLNLTFRKVIMEGNASIRNA